jgi:hypothetical protein
VLLRGLTCYINNKMTKKQFIAFADAVKAITDDYNRHIITKFLLDILPTFNSKFDSDKFVNYINK